MPIFDTGPYYKKIAPRFQVAIFHSISSESGRRRGCPRRPPTPPYERLRIRRFLICVCIINQQCLTSYKHPALPHDFRSPLPAFRPSCETSAQNVQKSGSSAYQVQPFAVVVRTATMASADFCRPIDIPYDASSSRQTDRSPRVIHTTFLP